MGEKERGDQLANTTYNDEGLRTSKTASGVTHKYVWEGSTLVSKSRGNLTTKLENTASSAEWTVVGDVTCLEDALPSFLSGAISSSISEGLCYATKAIK